MANQRFESSAGEFQLSPSSVPKSFSSDVGKLNVRWLSLHESHRRLPKAQPRGPKEMIQSLTGGQFKLSYLSISMASRAPLRQVLKADLLLMLLFVCISALHLNPSLANVQRQDLSVGQILPLRTSLDQQHHHRHHHHHQQQQQHQLQQASKTHNCSQNNTTTNRTISQTSGRKSRQRQSQRHSKRLSNSATTNSSSQSPTDGFTIQLVSPERHNREPVIGNLVSAARMESTIKSESSLRLDAAHEHQPTLDRLKVSPEPQKGDSCADCLAIPLVALVGDTQLSGYLIPTPRKHKSHTIGAYGGQNSAKYLPAASHHEQSRQQQHHPYYDHQFQSNLHSSAGLGLSMAKWQPKSDDKCPMSSQLTVCDNIRSYPADLILEKVEIARREFRRSGSFNIDSLFSDERSHSSDPFDQDESPNDKLKNNQQPIQSVAGVSSHDFKTLPLLDYDTAYGSNEENANHANRLNETQTLMKPRESSHQYSESSIAKTDSHKRHSGPVHVELMSKLRAQNQPERLESHSYNNQLLETSRGNSDSINDNGHPTLVPRYDPNLSSPIESTNIACDPQAAQCATSQVNASPSTFHLENLDFLNLVERRAVRISPKLQDHSQPLEHLDKHQALDPYHRVHDDQSNGNQIQEAAKSAGSRQTSPAGSPIIDQSSYNSVRLKFEPQAPIGIVGVPKIKGHDGHVRGSHYQDSGRRFRRQASVRVDVSSPARVMPEAEPLAVSPIVPANIADQPVVPEPICRARSIYISPKAALNDKKQWKYVVNTPELNPKIRQIIRVDICDKQKYSKKKLLALDSNSGLLEIDTFFIPSCCVCQLIPRASSIFEDTSSENSSSNSSSDDGSSEPTDSDGPTEASNESERSEEAS